MTRRSLFQYFVGVAASTVLARLPMSGKHPLQIGEVLTPQQRFNLSGLQIPFIPVIENGQYTAWAECVGGGFRTTAWDAAYWSGWLFACPECGIKAEQPPPWRTLT